MPTPTGTRKHFLDFLAAPAPRQTPIVNTVERAELVAGLVRLATAHEQALDFADSMLRITETGVSDSQRANGRFVIARWRQQLAAMRLRIATMLDQ